MANKTYIYYQPNKLDIKDSRGDCVIRALTVVMGKEWIQVFEEMIPICQRLQALHNTPDTYNEYLKSSGFVYTGISNKKGSKRPTVESFAKGHKSGKFFCNIANHCVGIVDGKYYDTWDCGYKSLYGYWEYKGEEN